MTKLTPPKITDSTAQLFMTIKARPNTKKFQTQIQKQACTRKDTSSVLLSIEGGHLSFFETVGEVVSFDGFFNAVKDTFTASDSAK